MLSFMFNEEIGGKVTEEYIGLRLKKYFIEFGLGQKLPAKRVRRLSQNVLKDAIYKGVSSKKNNRIS